MADEVKSQKAKGKSQSGGTERVDGVDVVDFVDGRILTGDAKAVLATLPAESVDCCVTSPPYWGLRDYGVDGQLGLERTPEEYVGKLVDVFGEVRRVLKPRGTLWLVIGDSYTSGGRDSHGNRCGYKQQSNRGTMLATGKRLPLPPGLKPKDLVGIPWMVAFAMRADGWWLRSEVVWNKPNAMPESCLDRPTRAHETIFLFSKGQRYYYDGAAVSEPCQSGPSDIRKMRQGKTRIDAKHFHTDVGPLAKANSRTNIGKKRAVGGTRYAMGSPGPGSRMYRDRDAQHLSRSGNKHRVYEGRIGHRAGNIPLEGMRRNRRSVWTVAAQPYRGAHFATFPTALITPCIVAGCPPGGVVLDPFMGAGTVALAAKGLGRHWLGIELKGEYVRMSAERLKAEG